MIGSSIRPASPDNLAAEISRLLSLPKDELRAAWRVEFHKDPPKGFWRELLFRTLVWSLQEKFWGGHDKALLKQLDCYARAKSEDPLFRRLKAGTVLVREYQGTRHTVTLMPEGFLWQGRSYSSLTTIAGLITGSKWNGPRFFGLRQRDQRSAGTGNR